MSNILIFVGFLLWTASASIYYLDPSGSDTNSGKSASAPWRTITKVKTSLFNPGDSILFKRDGRWRERLNIPSSGNAARPILFGAYGTGVNPLIDGLVDLVGDENKSWALSTTYSSGTKQIWYLRGCASAYSYRLFAYDEGNGLERSDAYAADAMQDKDFCRMSSIPEQGCWTLLFRYDAGNPTPLGVKTYSSKDTSSITRTINARTHSHLIDTDAKDYLIIENIDVRGGAIGGANFPMPAGVIINGSSFVILRGLTSSFNYSGVAFYDNGKQNNHNTFENLDIHHNLGAGIYFVQHSAYNIVRYCKVHHNYNRNGDDYVGDKLAIGCTDAVGFTGLSYRTGNQILYNTIYCNADRNNPTNPVGILDAAISILNCEETVIKGNLICDNDQTAHYFAQNSPNSSFISNVVIGNYSQDCAGHVRNQASSNTSFNSNTFIDDSVLSTKALIYGRDAANVFLAENSGTLCNNLFFGNHGSGSPNPHLVTILGPLVPDYNAYFGNSFVAPFRTLTASYASLTAWKAAGKEPHSFESDPRVTVMNRNNPVSIRIVLDPLSPLIDRGVKDTAVTSDIYGNPIYGTPDIGAVEYQPPYMVGIDPLDTAGAVRIYGNGKFRNTRAPSGTTAALSITPRRGFVPANFGEWMDVAILRWGALKEWTESSAVADTTSHTVKGLSANVRYAVTKNGTPLCSLWSNSNGEITFPYSGGYASAPRFIIQASASGSEDTQTVPEDFRLAVNHPNPFNPLTSFGVSVPRLRGEKRPIVSLIIYDIQGRTVAVLHRGTLGAGTHSFAWSARDGNGEPVAAGRYTIRMVAGKFMGERTITLNR